MIWSGPAGSQSAASHDEAHPRGGLIPSNFTECRVPRDRRLTTERLPLGVAVQPDLPGTDDSLAQTGAETAISHRLAESMAGIDIGANSLGWTQRRRPSSAMSER